jgi:hypothetical protein
LIVIVKGNTVHDYITIEKTMKQVINKLIILTSLKLETGSRETK